MESTIGDENDRDPPRAEVNRMSATTNSLPKSGGTITKPDV